MKILRIFGTLGSTLSSCVRDLISNHGKRLPAPEKSGQDTDSLKPSNYRSCYCIISDEDYKSRVERGEVDSAKTTKQQLEAQWAEELNDRIFGEEEFNAETMAVSG